MLGLATTDLCTKFEIFTLTHYKDMKGDEKCKNGLEYHNFEFSRLIGNRCCTSCDTLVRFGLVTPEF